MKKVIIGVAVFCAIINEGTAKSKKEVGATTKEIEIQKCTQPPKIDGILDDKAWNQSSIATDFYQFEPYNGASPSFQTEVRITYDDKAIYVGAMMYDPNPDSILTELSTRDDLGHSNVEIFAISLNPFNDGVNMVEFKVSAAGVQQDSKYVSDDEDRNWNSVWFSEVQITDEGWVAELKIPYSALRFPKRMGEAWGIHIFRHIRRYREWDSWNFVDSDQRGMVHQDGKLKGIKDIDPPLRLSLTPYVSGYLENNAEDNKWGTQFNGGMDLKFGISESFTLDMTLIPDFGQVQSDDQVLNLSPYEVKYNEKRPFFTEGTELFNKGDIFYSRRIGTRPTGYNDVEDKLNANEEIDENPVETKLINATKVSGRTSNGLGIGVFNAMTGAAYASVYENIYNEDSTIITKEYRDILTQGFTNYNMLVVDQSLKNNSYITLMNTNVMHDKEDYTANVTGTAFQLSNRDNSYMIAGQGAISQKYLDSTSYGHAYNIDIAKTSGKFQFSYELNVENDTYDINDLGYQRRNNEFENELDVSYNLKEPFWILRNFHSSIGVDYSMLYNPREYSRFSLNFRLRGTFAKNHFSTGLFGHLRPVESHDYFEPRVEGRVYKSAPGYYFNTFLSSDYRKMFAFDIRAGYYQGTEYNQMKYDFRVSPRVRVNDKLFITLRENIEKEFNETGYLAVDPFETGSEDIYFGRRDITTLNQTLEASYRFTNKAYLNLRARHYWSYVEYDDFYTLQDDGYLSDPLGYTTFNNEKDINFNAFTIDLKYEWHFAPGSTISVVWKNQIYIDENEIVKNYFNNFNNVIHADQINSFSVKILYYLDYQYLKRNKG